MAFGRDVNVRWFRAEESENVSAMQDTSPSSHEALWSERSNKTSLSIRSRFPAALSDPSAPSVHKLFTQPPPIVAATAPQPSQRGWCGPAQSSQMTHSSRRSGIAESLSVTESLRQPSQRALTRRARPRFQSQQPAPIERQWALPHHPPETLSVAAPGRC
jgi:hypothetical protein